MSYDYFKKTLKELFPSYFIASANLLIVYLFADNFESWIFSNHAIFIITSMSYMLSFLVLLYGEKHKSEWLNILNIASIVILCVVFIYIYSKSSDVKNLKLTSNNLIFINFIAFIVVCFSYYSCFKDRDNQSDFESSQLEAITRANEAKQIQLVSKLDGKELEI